MKRAIPQDYAFLVSVAHSGDICIRCYRAPHQPGKDPEPQDQGRAWPLQDTPFLQVLSGLREHLQCHLRIHWQLLPLTAGPPFREGKGPFFAFSLQNVWERSPGTDKTETRL